MNKEENKVDDVERAKTEMGTADENVALRADWNETDKFQSDIDDEYSINVMDREMAEDFAKRSPYRGMTPEQMRAYDEKFIQNDCAGRTSLGDIFLEAMQKKARGK
jgi:hypothetical protein